MPMKLAGRGIVIALTLVAVLAADVAIETLLRQHEQRREHEHTLAELNLVRARIETLVYRDLYAVRALATHIASLPELDQEDFEAYVKPLMQEPTTLRSLAAAPDLVIRYLYPWAGNETVLGTDYRQLPSQLVEVERTIASRTLVINGPTPLIQGGYGFIARKAVFLHSAHGPQKLWGVVSAVVDRDTLYSASGLRELGNRLALVIRAVDIADQNVAKVFFGDAHLFAYDVVQTTINLPHGRWILAARPHAGWLATAPRSVWILRIVACAIAALLVALVVSRTRYLRRQETSLVTLRRSERALRRSQQDLINAIEALNEGFALWDEDDHLQVFNVARRIYSGCRTDPPNRRHRRVGIGPRLSQRRRLVCRGTLAAPRG